MVIKTARLTIRIASNDEMRILIANENDKELKKAYSEMLELCIANPELRQWYAAWFIELPKGERIGDLCFKGLSSNGTVEIGYGLLPEHWGKGYATEAVKAMVEWASKQPGVKDIEAETEENNIPSQRVLQKTGFVPLEKNGEEGPRFVWRESVLQR
jgi:ribosomal-protein-alanine N-acetyltransferase